MQTGKDPGLDDMLADPLIARVMASDRVKAEEARALYAEVADRLRTYRDDLERETGRAGGSRSGGIVYA